MCFGNHKGHEGHKGFGCAGGAGRACAKAHVRPEGPVGAWRASHAMLWGRGADAPTTQVRRFRRFRRCRSAPAGRWKGAVQSGVSRRPICPIGPICPTAASKTASVGETQMFRRFARKTFGSSQILADLGELTQAGRMQGGGAFSPLPYYIADVEAICLLGKGGGRVCGGAFKGAF